MAPNVTCALLLFLVLKEKKKPSLLHLIYIFPFSASLFLEQERWKQSHTWHLVGTQHQKALRKSQSQTWLPCAFCPKCVTHDKEGIPRACFPSLPLPAPQLRNPLQLPKAVRSSSKVPHAPSSALLPSSLSPLLAVMSGQLFAIIPTPF